MKTEEENDILRPSFPIRLFLSLLFALFGLEMLIMFVILPMLFETVEGVVPNMTDSFLLALLIAPYLWIGVVRPLRHTNRWLNDELKKKVEQLLDAQEELVRQEKLATLGQIAGSVGHELRNPLGVMSNAVYYLQTVLADRDDTVREYLGIIKKEIFGAERIVSDLLDAVRTKPPRPQLVSAEEVIRMGLEKCRIPENITVDIQAETRQPVSVDPFQMKQVFVNLINNAVEAMPEGGALKISARLMKDEGRKDLSSIVPASLCPTLTSAGASAGCDASGRPSSVEFSFADTGRGIAPDVRAKLFQPLFTTKARGIGLGLVVVKNLTEANGGRIEVESREGEGTRFTLLLPAGGGAS